MGTLLLMVFANPDVLQWFPASGIMPPGGFPKEIGFFEKMIATLPYLVLPICCYTYASFAFTSRVVRSSIRDNMLQDHIRTAKAKGLPLPRIAFKHAFRNALLPAITVFSEVEHRESTTVRLERAKREDVLIAARHGRWIVKALTIDPPQKKTKFLRALRARSNTRESIGRQH